MEKMQIHIIFSSHKKYKTLGCRSMLKVCLRLVRDEVIYKDLSYYVKDDIYVNVTLNFFLAKGKEKCVKYNTAILGNRKNRNLEKPAGISHS